MVSVCVQTLVLWSVVHLALGGPSFLGQVHVNSSSIFNSDFDIVSSFNDAVGVGHGLPSDHFSLVRDRLSVTWRALPKLTSDRVNRRSLRHALHRYFLQVFGISISGLGPLHHMSDEVSLLSGHEQRSVRDLLQDTDAQSFSLDEAVVLSVAIEHLIHISTQNALLDAYSQQNFVIGQELTSTQLEEVIKEFTLNWMLQDDEVLKLARNDEKFLESVFDDWGSVNQWMQGTARSFEHSVLMEPQLNARRMGATWNPFNERFSFSDVSSVANKIVASFGDYLSWDCKKVKDDLVALDPGMTGRVPLSSFYQANLDGQWRFSESDHYLRQLGALDEDMSAGGAHVIIPNYVLSPNNCMGTTDHFTVCCRNECESFMDELEAAVGAPEASSDVLVDLVLDIAAIHSDSEPEVSVALRQQLKKIEGRNGGLVPLRGKPFAQWLQYMSPLECPFPFSMVTSFGVHLSWVVRKSRTAW
jgi:hypothetical protein